MLIHHPRYVQVKARLFCPTEALERAMELYHQALESARLLQQVTGRPFCFGQAEAGTGRKNQKRED
jgi:hypothetical protein